MALPATHQILLVLGLPLHPQRRKWSVRLQEKQLAQVCMSDLFRRDDNEGHVAVKEISRLGRQPHRFPLSKAAFRTVVSTRASFKAHSGTLEAQAVALSLRWLLRSVSRHSRRTVLFVDATAVCGAIAKGRSSAPTLCKEIMRIAALAIAGDLWPRMIYVPTEENPADPPSRGIIHRRRQRRSCIPATVRRAGPVKKILKRS